MRRTYISAIAVALVAAPCIATAQGGMNDANHAVAGGGILVPGWQGKADGSASANDAKFSKEGDALHIVTGPAMNYWNPANKASGDYTVRATFTEPHYMNLNTHDHPYGIFIGGNELGTADQTLLYCATYGDGRFIVRGFAPGATQRGGAFYMNAGGEANPAIHKAAGKDQPVTQDIAVSVKGDKVTCSVNGAVVGTYEKGAVVGAGKLKSTDGVYGIRSAHNTEVMVTGLTMTKP